MVSFRAWFKLKQMSAYTREGAEEDCFRSLDHASLRAILEVFCATILNLKWECDVVAEGNIH